MPLPECDAREEMHCRNITMRGYRRSDGKYDIEGRITDIKPQPFTPRDGKTVDAGSPLHDMWVRLVIDEDLLVHEVFAATDSSPHPECPKAAVVLDRLKGVRISAGWKSEIKRRLGGAQGCTHLRELLNTMASAAYQTLTTVRQSKPISVDTNGRPKKLDSCHAFGSEQELVRKRWPQFYTGSDRAESSKESG